jgi:hypothetical protein
LKNFQNIHQKLYTTLTFKSYIKSLYMELKKIIKPYIQKASYMITSILFKLDIKTFVLEIKKLSNHI